MENTHITQTNNVVDEAVNRVQVNMTNLFEKKFNEIQKQYNEIQRQYNQIQKENKESANKINNFIGVDNLYPLLEYVSKFRLLIVKELINDKQIPPTCNDWTSMFQHLEEKCKGKKNAWKVIDDKAEDLGLSFDDWLVLKLKSTEVNCHKHPTKMKKDEAYAKIETLKGTQYENFYEPLRNLVDLFETKEWINYHI